jgi:hypothetical protein
VPEKRKPRRAVGHEKAGWRKRIDENIHNFYFSLDIVMAIETMKFAWAGRVRGKEDMAYEWTYNI